MRRRALLAGALGAAAAGASGGCRPAPDAPRAAAPAVADAERLLAARARALLRERGAAAAGLRVWAVDVEGVDGTAVRGRLRARVAGEGREVAAAVRARLVRGDDGWELGALDGAVQPWDLGDVRAQPTGAGPVLLVRPDGTGSDGTGSGATGSGGAGSGGAGRAAAELVAADAAEDLPAAAARVDAAWGADWPRGTAVVVVPAAAAAARLAGLNPARAAALDAAAVGLDAALPDGAPAGVRVVLVAERCARLTRAGRTATLTHELVHVATRATATARPGPDGARPVPRWLAEGYADHVARRDLGVPAALLAAPLLDELDARAARGAPAEPAVPSDADLTATGPRLQVAYAAAWTLVTSAARAAGTPAVTALHRRLATAPADGGEGPAPAAQRLDAACRAALGAGWEEVVRTWRADLAGRLVGWGP